MSLKQVTRMAIHHGLIPSRIVPWVRFLHIAADIIKLASKY